MSKNSSLQRLKALKEWWFIFERNRKYKPKRKKKIDLNKIVTNEEDDQD